MLKRCVVVLLACVFAFSASAQRRRAALPPQPDAITILQTTDLHDHGNGSGHQGLESDPVAMSTTGAYARIAAYVNYVRGTAGHPVILVDSGDWTMGTLYDLTLTSKPLALYFINAMKYDAVTIGNHEWDYTPKGLAAMIAAAKSNFAFNVPIVASNMELNGSTDLAPLFGSGKAIQQTYVETLPNGVKVGFIGLLGEDAAIESPAAAPVTFDFLSFNYDTIQALVDNLRNTQGAQIVIALSHSGTDASGTTGEDINLAKHVHGINVIASGHTHTPLAAAHSVTNGNWTTQIIDAGAFGTNVGRLELRIDRTNGTSTPLSFNNVAMTTANLNAIKPGLNPDPATIAVVSATDQQLNTTLAPVLSQAFSDYDPSSLFKGIYHPVAQASQDMNSNDRNPVLGPNGLGNLAADSVRNVANSIIATAPTNVPSYDYTPYQLGVVATGVIRANLQSGKPITFSDIYNVLPLGISPDTTQALPIGYPMISAYADPGDVKKICALQLVGQSNLIGSSFYLNMSGIRYTLKPAETYTYFKYATAASILLITSGKVGTSTAAAQTLSAVLSLSSDHGAALIAAANSGNPYAGAIVKLNDANPDATQINTNLNVFGEVISTSLFGTAAVSALVLSKAVAAIDTVSGFAVTDANNTGTSTILSTTNRIRVAVDLYALLLLNAVESQYGVKITAYQAATGTTTLSGSDFPTLLGNRIDASPATNGVQELKEWMTLLQNVGTGMHGAIGPEYLSTANFAEFPAFGNALKVRDDAYPLAQIGALVTTAATLQAAP
ncbi:MAG TPA: metallophosphoesterase [Thermoanaerobaculia bacterium]